MNDTFTFRGHELPYLDHPYNATRLNERAVEVPIAEAWLTQLEHETGDVLAPSCHLEIGNVLEHYGLRPPWYRCIDLHEDADDTIREDIRTWVPPRSLDAVVSISTFEHVGEDEGRPEDALVAMERIASMLAPGGAMLVTIGLGQNPVLDEALITDGTSAVTACTLVSDPINDRQPIRTWRYGPKLETRPYIGHSGQGAGAVWVGQFGRAVL